MYYVTKSAIKKVAQYAAILGLTAMLYVVGSLHTAAFSPPRAPRLSVAISVGTLYPGVQEAVHYHITNETTTRIVLYSVWANTYLAGTWHHSPVLACDAAHSGVLVHNRGPMIVRGRAENFVTLSPHQIVVVTYQNAITMSPHSPSACEGLSFSFSNVRVNAS